MLGRAAADWALVEPDGRILADVRLTLQTDDGAVILMTYEGRGDSATGVVHTAPRFETGDERYAWLTRIQAVGKGVFDGATLEYELYEVCLTADTAFRSAGGRAPRWATMLRWICCVPPKID